jgi:hypothetical protein
MNSKLKGTRVSNYVRKDGDHKGKTFFIYDVTGAAEDIKKFKASPSQKKWPRVNSITGAPQIHTMYIDPLRKENPLYLKQDGNYTLDQSETREDLGVLQALRDTAPELVGGYTEHLVEKSWGAGKASNKQLNAFTPKTETPAPTGEGANLDKVE